MAFEGNKWKTTHEMLRVGEKNFDNRKTIMRVWHLSQNHESPRERIRYGGKTLLRSSNVENDDEKHHQELFKPSERIKSEEVEPTMKRI